MVKWTKSALETFIEEACLSEEDEQIVRLRAKGRSRVRISIEMNMSLSCVDKHISKIKEKYRIVSSYKDL